MIEKENVRYDKQEKKRETENKEKWKGQWLEIGRKREIEKEKE